MALGEMTPWIRRPYVRPDAHIRLFCFPHAGGTTDIFSGWAELLGDHVEVALVQLPGRGQRFREPTITDMKLLIDSLKQAILPYDDMPFAFFGHSMGALVAFELSRSLKEHPQQIKHLFLSACPAPQRLPRSQVHKLADAVLIDYLITMGGTPAEILDDHELIKVILPVVRSDFQLVENYQFTNQSPLQIPLSLCMGESDPKTNIEDISLWGGLFSAGYNTRIFPGSHFYIRSQAINLAAWISANLGVR
jgi:medium-chain acyl-[acyl-carrier-protein] hydrolase